MATLIPYKPVGIFWDIENCAVPKQKSPAALIAHIRSQFVSNRLNHREFEFLIACDITKLRKDLPEDINRAGGVTLAHVSGQSKNAADEKIRDNMKKFVDTHITVVAPVLVLISGDIDFINDLRGYQMRLGCQIILLHSPKCSGQFKIGWNEIYAFEQFCAGIPAVSGDKSLGGPGPGAAATSGYNQGAGQKQQGNKPGPGNGQQPQQKKDKGPKSLQQQQPGTSNHGHGPHPSGGAGPQNKQQNKPANATSTNFKPPQPQVHFPGPSKAGPAPKQRKDSDSSSHSGGAPNETGAAGGGKKKNKKPPPNPGYLAESVRVGVNQMNIQGHGHGNGNTGAEGAPANKNKNQWGAAAAAAAAPGPAARPINLPNFILLVMGLPGKMEYTVLKEKLQVYADQVEGRVYYVKNGQGFIGFRTKEAADKAVALFDGVEVYGKKLNVSFTKNIPFDNPQTQKDKKPKHGPALPAEDFVMVNAADVPPAGAVAAVAGPAKAKAKPNKEAAAAGGSGNAKEASGSGAAPSGSLQEFLADPSFVGTMAGAMIREITNRRGGASGSGSGGAPAAGKGQESCPIQ